MTPTQQLLAKLRECETTMTKGKWLTRGSGDWGMARTEYIEAISDECFVEIATTTRGAMSAFKTPDSDMVRQGRIDFDGIATLKNSNPTVIAMLERAIGALEGASLAVRQGCASDATDIIRDALADLDALAREALREKTDGK